jgi:hypothetical protein
MSQIQPEMVIYYIYSSDLTFDELKNSFDIIFGYAEVVFNYSLQETIIVSIRSNLKGCGSLLLDHIARESRKKNIDKITLDDMSDRFRQAHNIYVKFGFIYRDNTGPEMIADADTIVKNAPKISGSPLDDNVRQLVLPLL